MQAPRLRVFLQQISVYIQNNYIYTTKTNNVEKITDLSYLEEIAAGDQSFIIDIIDTFIRQVPDFIKNMKRYLQERDFSRLAKEAHTAKSSVILFGLNHLAGRLKEFQSLADKMENIAAYENYIQEFEDTCNRAIQEIKSKYHS
jgi:HPt (histidine-containing phosphotransfer) domain-containing protein